MTAIRKGLGFKAVRRPDLGVEANGDIMVISVRHEDPRGEDKVVLEDPRVEHPHPRSPRGSSRTARVDLLGLFHI